MQQENVLNVREIFRAIDGEVNGFKGSGQLTMFLRLAGCNLRCPFCDTKYALKPCDGHNMFTSEVVAELLDSPKITITGGEPLLQKWQVVELIDSLMGLPCPPHISIETNGSISVPWSLLQNPNVRIVADYKLSSVQQESKMNMTMFHTLSADDVIKFVVSDQEDFDRMVYLIYNKLISCSAKFVVSPAISEEDQTNGKYPWAQKLAEMLIEEQLWNVQYSLQIHKVLWPNSKEER